jgi:hypothetical protein
MQYEFFFLKQRRQAKPRILRAIASTHPQARLMVAHHFGFDPSQSGKTVKQYLESLRIHDVEATNIFPMERTKSRPRTETGLRNSA